MKGKQERFIDLYGYTKGIASKNNGRCTFYFSDDTWGKLTCTVHKEHILYYNIEKGKKYHLKVKLEGYRVAHADGNKSLRNALIVKESQII